MQFLLLGLSSMLATLIGMMLVLKLYPKLGLMDRPHDYGHKRSPVPYSIGIIALIVFIGHVIYQLPLTKELLGVLAAGSVLVVFGMCDDYFRIKARYKLIVQLLATLLVVVSGVGIEVISNPFGGAINLGLWQIPVELWGVIYHITPIADLFTIAWIILLVNAINFMDGVPGLVTGIGTIAGLTMLGLCVLLITSTTTTLFEKEQAFYIAQMASVFVGSLFVINRFDFGQPKVVIGDSLSTFIGYALAIMAIFAGGKVATTLIVLSLPFADALWMIVRRIARGQSPFRGDDNHYHHKLQRLGLSSQATCYTIYGITALLGAISLIFLFHLQTFGKAIALILVIALMFITSAILIKKETNTVRST